MAEKRLRVLYVPPLLVLLAFSGLSQAQTSRASELVPVNPALVNPALLEGFSNSDPGLFPASTVTPASVFFDQQGQTQNQQQPSGGQQNLPNAPSANKPQEPTLEELGISPSAAKGNAKEQALLDKRSRMLKTHQKLGLITTIPMVATVVSSFGAGGKQTSTTNRDLHIALGGVATGMYFATAYYAIRAPRISGTETRGQIKLHKALAWIHGPGMILTPILGIMAYEQKSKGERIHGLASAHGPVGIVTAGAFGAALLSVSVKF